MTTGTGTPGRPLTGRKVLAITLAAFGVILAANLTLLWAAIGSFPGLEVRNSYVASQNFDRERAAQEALGWDTGIAYAAGRLELRLTDAAGAPVIPMALAGLAGRTTTAAADRPLAFRREGSVFIAETELAPGTWEVRIEAEATDGTRFRRRHDILVRNGQ